ncbi:helix-turn-helix domain-containing protein [Kosakonia sp. H02]|nr:helix-turn-helix domain-containing protein [Kosakonia sp. H02]
MESLTVYGYRLGNDHEVEFVPCKKRLINHAAPGNSEYLRTTMANLLAYLLEHAVGNVVADKTLQIQVWENNGLSCSSQRLWQVMNNLKRKLATFDLPEEFILRVGGKGYLIPEEKVLQLFCRNTFFHRDDLAASQRVVR